MHSKQNGVLCKNIYIQTYWLLTHEEQILNLQAQFLNRNGTCETLFHLQENLQPLNQHYVFPSRKLLESKNSGVCFTSNIFCEEITFDMKLFSQK